MVGSGSSTITKQCASFSTYIWAITWNRTKKQRWAQNGVVLKDQPLVIVCAPTNENTVAKATLWTMLNNTHDAILANRLSRPSKQSIKQCAQTNLANLHLCGVRCHFVSVLAFPLLKQTIAIAHILFQRFQRRHSTRFTLQQEPMSTVL